MESIEMEPNTSNYAFYNYLPYEIIVRINDYLNFDDSYSFQISDDDSDCYIEDMNAVMRRRTFTEQNFSRVFEACKRISQIVIIVKDFNMLLRYLEDWRTHLIKGWSMYHIGGYVGHVLAAIPYESVQRLSSVSLHIDVLQETFTDLWFPCPVEDLRFALENLCDANFETFIQIAFCVATVTESDSINKGNLINGMNAALKEADERGAYTDFSLDNGDGYVDMTVIKGYLEYSFAFFYYNAEICQLP